VAADHGAKQRADGEWFLQAFGDALAFVTVTGRELSGARGAQDKGGDEGEEEEDELLWRRTVGLMRQMPEEFVADVLGRVAHRNLVAHTALVSMLRQ
jgi:hypothetical protein